MDDKCIMENILLVEKGACDLYLHGTIESGTANVNQAFGSALTETLSMQSNVYQEMSQRGWYQAEQAESQKMQKVKNKFSPQQMNQGS